MSSGDFDFGDSGPEPAPRKKDRSTSRAPAAGKTSRSGDSKKSVVSSSPSAKSKAPAARSRGRSPAPRGGSSKKLLVAGLVLGAMALAGGAVAAVLLLQTEDDSPGAKAKGDAAGKSKSIAKANVKPPEPEAPPEKKSSPPVPAVIPRTLAELRRFQAAQQAADAAKDAEPKDTGKGAPASPIGLATEDPEGVRPAAATGKPPGKQAAAPKNRPGVPAWKAKLLDEFEAAEQEAEAKSEKLQAVIRKMDVNRRTDFQEAVRFLTERLDKASEEDEAEVIKIAPEIVARYRRELEMQSGEYLKEVKEGKKPARLSMEQRKQKYSVFQGMTGLAEKWTLNVPFDDLSAKEMDQAINAVEKCIRGSIQVLEPDERQVLYRTRAFAFIRKAIETGR